MRGALLAVVAVLAARLASAEDSDWMNKSPRPAQKGIDLSIGRAYRFSREGRKEPDVLLHGAIAPPPGGEGSALPGLDIGRFHAGLGGMAGRHVQLGTYELDTRDFLGSRISGSIDGRGARVTFTIPMH